MATATFVDELPKVARGRTHTPTPEDDAIAQLVKRGSGALSVDAGDDPEKVRRAFQSAARYANVKVRTVVSDGKVFVALK